MLPRLDTPLLHRRSAKEGQLGLLVRLRWLFAGGCGALALVGLATTHLPVVVPAAVGLALLCLNLASLRALRRSDEAWRTPTGLCLQLVGDTLALALLVQQTGGLASPAVGAFLVPIALGANLLPRRTCAALVVVVLCSYTVQHWLPKQLPHLHGIDAFDLHQAGMWLTVVVAAILLASMLTRSAELVRLRERELALAREAMLAQERLVAVATLATNAAHELATPLATMSVTVEELASDAALDPTLRADVALLGRQIERCRGALDALAREAGTSRGDTTRRMPLARWLSEVAEQWRVRRPEVSVRLDCEQPGHRDIIVERSLGHTLHWLLDHAARDSSDEVELAAEVDAVALKLAVRHRHEGLPEALRDALRDPAQSAGELPHATITQLGGQLEARARQGGGTEFVLSLPLALMTP